MPPVRIPVPTLTGGVTRQPISQRRSDQLEECTNYMFSIQNGLEKRAGSTFIAADGTGGRLSVDGTPTDVKAFWVERDTSRRNLILVKETVTSSTTPTDAIQIFSEDGVERTIAAGGNGEVDNMLACSASDFLTYLGTGTGNANAVVADNIRMITVGDTTFVLNTAYTVGLTGSAPSYTYITVSGASFDPLDTNTRDYATLVDEILDDQIAGSDWSTAVTAGNHVYLNTANSGYPEGYYQATSNAPPYITRVVGDGDTNYSLDPLTMPHVIYRTDATTFKLYKPDWTPRYSGSADTNPPALFNGKTISGQTFHQNRLWFTSGESVSSSEAGEFFNFWLDVAGEVVDSDRIEATLSTDSVNTITWPVSFRDSLFFLTDGEQQFEGRSVDSTLAPQTFSLVQAASYKAADIKPEILGSQLYFASDRGGYPQVYEYYYNSDGVSSEAVDISQHIQGYLPNNITQMEASGQGDMMFLLSDATGERDAIYVNQSLWAGQEKVQNAWGKWTLDAGNGDTEIESINVFDNHLYILTKHDSLYWLEKIEINNPTNDTGLSYSVRLDRKRTSTGNYDAATGLTTFTLSNIDDTELNRLVLGEDFDASGRVFVVTAVLNGADTEITLDGDWTAGECFIGLNFNASATLSPPVYRDQNQTIVQGHVQVRRLVVYHEDTATYTVNITPVQRDEIVRRFVAARVGATLTTNETLISDFGRFVTAVMSPALGTVITIDNDNPAPNVIISLEWQCTFIPGRVNIAK